jgi:multiple sugar transport system substrate-binding protein
VNETIIPAFEEMMAEQGKNVNVTTLEFVGSGDDQRQQYVLDLGVGAGTDIMTMDGFWLPEFVEGGLLKPLTEVVGPEVMEWEGWSVTPEGLKNILAFGGEVFGLARGTDARVIWYRADLFEQAGLPADWQPTSWEELLDAARTVKENLEGVTPIQLNAGTAMTEATTMQGYLMALLGAGHHIYDFEEAKWIVSSPGILNTLKLYETIYVTEELGDPRFQLSANGREDSFTAFAAGEVAMLVEGDYFWRGPLAEGGNQAMENRDEVVKFAKMPAIEPGAGFNGQDFVTISGGTGYIINPNTEHPEEAWALLSFMFSKEQVDALQALQPRIRARTDVEVPNDETMSLIASEVLPLTTIRPMLPEYNSVSSAAQLMTERVVSGEMTPEEAMAAYDEEVTALVGEENVIRLPVEE